MECQKNGAGRGAALDPCKGLSRKAPQEQLDAADPLVMQRIPSDSLCLAPHAFALKGCALHTWGIEGPAPHTLAPAVLTSHPVQASPGWIAQVSVHVFQKPLGSIGCGVPGVTRWL